MGHKKPCNSVELTCVEHVKEAGPNLVLVKRNAEHVEVLDFRL
jgi:hypothetical protein